MLSHSPYDNVARKAYPAMFVTAGFYDSNGGRAILAMEKGAPGDRAFAEAFAAWEKK